VTDVFDLFGTPDEDPALREALQDLSDAVRDAVARSGGLTREPDLTALSGAVGRVLEAAGCEVSAADADRWHEYEASGREGTHRRRAWELADVVFRESMAAAGHPPGAPTTDPADPSYPVPGGLPLASPEG